MSQKNTSLDDVAASGLLDVWDCADKAWQGICEFGPHGARVISERKNVPLSSVVDRRENSAKDRRTATMCGIGPAIWCLDGGCDIWSDAALCAHAQDGKLLLRGHSVAVTSIVEVVSFLDSANLGRRGVRVNVENGATLLVIEEVDPSAQMDPTYNWDNALIDGAWADFLAIDLAKWLGVPHRKER